MRRQKRKRETRVKRELRRHGGKNAGHGWAARQAAKNRGRSKSGKKIRVS